MEHKGDHRGKEMEKMKEKNDALAINRKAELATLCSVPSPTHASVS